MRTTRWAMLVVAVAGIVFAATREGTGRRVRALLGYAVVLAETKNRRLPFPDIEPYRVLK